MEDRRMVKLTNAKYRPIFIIFAAAILPVIALLSGCDGESKPTHPEIASRLPHLFPYTCGAVIPPNIAPLNFSIRENGDLFFVSIASVNAPSLEIRSASPDIRIPSAKWRALLAHAQGGTIAITVAVKNGNSWQQYQPLIDTISTDSIDPYLVYRRLPVCKDWSRMGLYERELGGFSEEIIYHNKKSDVCFNCHSFRNNDPQSLIFQIRSPEYGTPMVVGNTAPGKNAIGMVDTKTAFTSGKAGFAARHPTHDLVAFSMNKFEMLFHASGIEPRTVFNGSGDLAVCDLRSNNIFSPPQLRSPSRIETMPAWSPDGASLYFCCAPQLPENRYREIRCDLMKIGFNPASLSWGKLDTVLSAAAAGGSICQPRCSPDGRFILITVAPYGDFPIDKSGSRLALFDTRNSTMTKLDADSSSIDGWHGWSQSGRWIVFTSKRLNRRFSSVYFCYCDSSGVMHRPFILPQEDPAWYASSLAAVTVPEFTKGKIPYSMRTIQAALDNYKNHHVKPDVVTSATAVQSEY
jgi:hypothetical protein